MSSPPASLTTSSTSSGARPRSSCYCCVVGCSNNRTRDSKRGISFYTFPKRNIEQKELWIKAVKRMGPDGSLWIPGPRTQICSEHFVGGKKSPTRGDPAYSPTLFPTKHTKEKSLADKRRHERAMERRNRSFNAGDDSLIVDPEEGMDDVSHEMVKSVETQTDVVEQESSHQTFSFSCTYISETEAATEVVSPPLVCQAHKSSGTVTTFVAHKLTDTQDLIHNSVLEMNDECFKAYTGVKKQLFQFILFKLGESLTDSVKLSRDKKLALFLMKLKLNLSFVVLAGKFDVKEESVSKWFYRVLDTLYDMVKPLIYWPSKGKIQSRMPASFKALFPQTRAIIDCSEIHIQRPKTVHQRVQFYSNYKSGFTAKFLVAVAPSGEIIFLSQAFGGRATDAEITVQSGFLDLLEPGDVVLADKGFPRIEEDLVKAGAFLVMPPFKSGGRQFSESQNRGGYECASVRIHVERAIGRMKYFEILTYLRNYLLPQLDKILVIISFLCNCCDDLIKDN